MKVDAVLVIRRCVFQIVGKASDGREFMSRRGVKVGVARARVRCPMPNAEIGKARRLVGANWNVAPPIDHEVMGALVPFQVYLRYHITKARHAAVDIYGPPRDEGTK